MIDDHHTSRAVCTVTVLLPDVSEFQAPANGNAPNWAGIKKQNGGAAVIRVGYGDAHLDHMFVANYTAMKASKFSFMGLYHYLRAGQDAAAQAAQFCAWVGPPSAVAPGTVFMLDLEEGNGSQFDRANTWLAHVDKFYGLEARPLNERSWLYSYTSFVTTHNLSAIFASPRRTWIAAYQTVEPVIGHTLWQSTDGKTGAHITSWAGCGRVDTSLYHGTLAELSALGWKGSATPPVTKPPVLTPPSFHGEYITAGMFSLADLCKNVLGVPTNTALRATAVHYGSYEPVLAGYINDVMTGNKPHTAPVPKGAKIWCN